MINEVEKLIAEHFGLGKVHKDDHLSKDLGGDALDTIELIMALEEKFNIEISDDEADRMQIVQDVCECVSTKLRVEI